MPSLTDDGCIRRILLLEIEDCRAELHKLDALRPRWTERGKSFFTLGAAAYLDLCGGGSPARYRDRGIASNSLIRAEFGPLLGQVASALQQAMGAPCVFHKDFALPGFHIFLTRSLDTALRDHLHLDLQHNHFECFDYDTPSFTFTLPLELPAAGGGIELCLADPTIKRGRLVEHNYVLGELFVHSGRALHRRLHRSATPDCRRVTLQGHGVRDREKWILYW